MKVSYINGICVHHDAISQSVRDEIQRLAGQGGMDVRLFAYACDYADIPFQHVQTAADIALDPHFQASDLVVFHFGVHYPLFDLLPAVSKKARRLVVFHNITPRDMVAPDGRETIDRSFAQLSNMVWADHVLCASATNLQVLRAASIRTPASVMPLSVGVEAMPAGKPSFQDGLVRIAFLGRFVRSKGPHELLRALSIVMATLPVTTVELNLIGNLNFSDQDLLAQLRVSAAALEESYPGRLRIVFHGSVSNQHKQVLLNEADLFVLPTYHEGFCVPIIEALAAGCRVVVYENSNTPSISGGVATLVPTGDVPLLAKAVRDELCLVTTGAWQDSGYRDHGQRIQRHVRQFCPTRVGHRFIRFIEKFMRVHG